jgi:lipoprotein-anchoring transpeptidase ErfK/SrfK
MKSILTVVMTLAICSAMLAGSGCEVAPNRQISNSNSASTSNANLATRPANTEQTRKAESEWAVTLPVLDAFFADDMFASELKSKLQLTDQQISRLREISQEATAKLRQSGRDNNSDYASTADLSRQAEKDIGDVIGAEKVPQMFALVADRWNGEGATAENFAMPVGVPVDTRVVVNDPAFRMDIFENGQMIKSYKIGIGYPEFPLPTGLRMASTIIFNPTWTPPDEPWVEAPGSKVAVGETVKAGDKLNPLGVLKIPIGSPSLIHGGKLPARIGNFASHGCVGLTDTQAIDFAKWLAYLGGTELTDSQIAQYGKDKTETKTVKLSNPVMVELRYETITVEDGKLHIYRDVYDRGTNTEQNLRTVLTAYGVTLEQLSEPERAQVMKGLNQMSRDAAGKPSVPDQANSNSKNSNSNGKITRVIKGEKEVVIDIAALKGKGYPAPVDLDTGTNTKSKKSSPNNRQKARE